MFIDYHINRFTISFSLNIRPMTIIHMDRFLQGGAKHLGDLKKGTAIVLNIISGVLKR